MTDAKNTNTTLLVIPIKTIENVRENSYITQADAFYL